MPVDPEAGGRPSSSRRRPPVALLAAVLVALAGCGGSEGETSRGAGVEAAPGTAQTQEPSEKVQLAARLSTACRRATGGGTLPRPDRAGEIGEYARGSLSRTQRTIAELASLQVPPAFRPQVARLRTALSSLLPLYEQAAEAAATKDRAALGGLTPILPAAERSAADLARDLAARSCAPGG